LPPQRVEGDDHVAHVLRAALDDRFGCRAGMEIARCGGKPA